MALPTIAINSGTGSNTAASGAGPATALFGTAASIASSTTVTLLTDNPDLSGVATDGSAVIWVGSSTGKQFAKITGVNNTAGVKTVTVSDAYGATESGKNWGIGGKRATLAGSTQLGIDCRSGWTIDVQDNQTLTANFTLKPNAVAAQWTTFTSTTTTRPVITTATNSIYGLDIAGAANLVISHLKFTCTAGTRGNGIGLASNTATSGIVITDCVLDGWANGIIDRDAGNNTGATALVISGCEILNCSTAGISSWNGAQVDQCYLHANAIGIAVTQSQSKGVNLFRVICDSNTSHGASLTTAASVGIMIDACVFSNNGGAGVTINPTAGLITFTARNSIFWTNTTYGVAVSATNLDAATLVNNAFGGNLTNPVQSPLTTGTGAITLTASPFVSSTDFGLNSTAGGGALCKAAAATIPNASANTAGDVGAVPTGGGAAAGATSFAY